jgi:hypothetical protein
MRDVVAQQAPADPAHAAGRLPMIRFHVHVTTLDLASSIRTYSHIFGPPAVEKLDYAKWEPDGFPVIFAVSTRKGVAGIDHLGIKADSDTELAAMRVGLQAEGLQHVEQRDAACCYVRADKLWVTDPNGVPWELYAGKGSIEMFGDDARPATDASCCATEPAGPLLSLGPKRH